MTRLFAIRLVGIRWISVHMQKKNNLTVKATKCLFGCELSLMQAYFATFLSFPNLR